MAIFRQVLDFSLGSYVILCSRFHPLPAAMVHLIPEAMVIGYERNMAPAGPIRVGLRTLPKTVGKMYPLSS